MQFPAWVKPAIGGAVGGAIAITIIGFSWGGWTTSGNAQTLANQAAAQATVAALVPYCLARAGEDPAAATLIAELKEARPNARRTVVENAGWATPLNADRPDRALAQACQEALYSS